MDATHEAQAVLLALQTVVVEELVRELPEGAAERVLERAHRRLAEMARTLKLQPEADEWVAARVARLLGEIDVPQHA